MLNMVVTFLVLALLAGFLGFSGVQIISLEIARVLFVLFLILFGCSMIAHLMGYGKAPRP
jgi:uncharacterized membrane protein YtjA (UPF0391 family)